MKNTFSRVLVLGLLVCASTASWAQEEDLSPMQKGFRFYSSQSNPDEYALLMSFYRKIFNAKSFHGCIAITKTQAKEGKVVSKRDYEIESYYLSDRKEESNFLGENRFKKSAFKITNTISFGEKIAIERFERISDRNKEYNFDELKKVWSERNQNDIDAIVPLKLTRDAWFQIQIAFGPYASLRIDRQSINREEKLIVTTEFQGIFVFDAKSGELQSWKVIKPNWMPNNPDEVTEYRWLKTEFDMPLPDSIFQWKVPEGAKQVAPETISVPLDLH
ncbi:hypothetical protein B1R32_10835 [Abditibacterium utsteinense]|uniref:Uncharacterized protein n=1 Tax=Abditibacterium utsteinense TaxID=1960156 RepID=A0A2S8SSQ4_9BACT|nr:hypothetical protein [Abditibacterium utsteinense]PQV63831.1 hypothetical protein B1R32_10835 [Abditibacterium utsteinense]